jgi:arsenite-transporting ATPase
LTQQFDLHLFLLIDIPRPVQGVPRLSAMNIDPDSAAEAYRTRVLAQLGPETTEVERATVREQLAGACTTEIAAFDEFAGLLAGGAAGFDHVIFDTAPTGHTLRLLSLPKAWSGLFRRLSGRFSSQAAYSTWASTRPVT